MSMLGSQCDELRKKADMLDGLEGMDNLVRMLREAADTIESMRVRLQELQGVGGESRYTALFGTPERAARTLYYDKTPICAGCALLDECSKIPDEDQDTCLLIDYDALLEWLRGDA